MHENCRRVCVECVFNMDTHSRRGCGASAFSFSVGHGWTQAGSGGQRLDPKLCFGLSFFSFQKLDALFASRSFPLSLPKSVATRVSFALSLYRPSLVKAHGASSVTALSLFSHFELCLFSDGDSSVKAFCLFSL